MSVELPTPSDKPLFTPGPLTTSRTVKQAMLTDLGSRDAAFIEVVRWVRAELLRVGGVSKEKGWETVIMQGSGTFGVEAMLTTFVPRDGRLLVAVNGAYGERMVQIAKVHGIACVVVECSERDTVSPSAIAEALDRDPAITDVAVIHGETTTGLINPLADIGHEVHSRGRRLLVDSMSAFGGVPTDLEEVNADVLVSSSNKCIEGVPGFSFALCRRALLEGAEGQARTVALDLVAQWRGLEKSGQFRFTPPTHAILAFAQALRELAQEGGVAARHQRYKTNGQVVLEGMMRLGYEPYLRPEDRGPIISTFLYPKHAQFNFESFYTRLSDRGFVIYPGKLSKAEAFRIGHIGRLFPRDMSMLLHVVEETMREMGLPVPLV